MRTGDWAEPFDAAMALSADEEVWGQVNDLKRVIEDRSAVGYLDDDGVFNVVVSPTGPAVSPSGR